MIRAAAGLALSIKQEDVGINGHATEARIYAAVAAACARGCFVSVGHRPELAKYHSHVLESAGEGRWRLLGSREWAEERRARALAEEALEGE